MKSLLSSEAIVVDEDAVDECCCCCCCSRDEEDVADRLLAPIALAAASEALELLLVPEQPLE